MKKNWVLLTKEYTFNKIKIICLFQDHRKEEGCKCTKPEAITKVNTEVPSGQEKERK